MTKLTAVLALVVTLTGCCGAAAPAESAGETCVVAQVIPNGTYQLWQFDPVPAENPDPASCDAMGGGLYKCQTLTACTVDEGSCLPCHDLEGNVLKK